MFFCFKQKTAYEMRISDWSSDVCSSDLEDIDSLDRLAGKQVDPGDARARIRLADNLRPAARRDAQVDDRARLLEQAEFFVDLDQLVRGARAITQIGRAHV